MHYEIFHITSEKRLLADVRLCQYAAWDVQIKYKLNDSGELSLAICAENPEFEYIGCATSEVVVERDGLEIWRGRVVEQEIDANGNKHILAKGVLDYLHDTICPPQTIWGTVADVFQSLLAMHNAKPMEARKQLAFGGCDLTDIPQDGIIVRTAATTWAVLSQLIRDYGGYIRVNRENNANTVYWRRELTHINKQAITAGVNLLSLTQSITIDGLATVVYAYGKSTDDIPLGIESVNDGLPYVADTAAISSFGWIEAAYTDSSCEDPQQLKNDAATDLAARLSESASWELDAVDLADLGANIEQIEIGDIVPLITNQSREAEKVQCTGLVRFIFEPQKTKITLGTSFRAISNLIGGIYDN